MIRLVKRILSILSILSSDTLCRGPEGYPVERMKELKELGIYRFSIYIKHLHNTTVVHYVVRIFGRIERIGERAFALVGTSREQTEAA